MGMRQDADGKGTADRRRPRSLKLFGREFQLPKSRLARIAIGVNLIFFGLLGFLPVLGFWMIPLGLLMLSFDVAVIRRLRRRMIVMYNGRQKSKG